MICMLEFLPESHTGVGNDEVRIEWVRFLHCRGSYDATIKPVAYWDLPTPALAGIALYREITYFLRRILDSADSQAACTPTCTIVDSG